MSDWRINYTICEHVAAESYPYVKSKEYVDTLARYESLTCCEACAERGFLNDGNLNVTKRPDGLTVGKILEPVEPETQQAESEPVEQSETVEPSVPQAEIWADHMVLMNLIAKVINGSSRLLSMLYVEDAAGKESVNQAKSVAVIPPSPTDAELGPVIVIRY